VDEKISQLIEQLTAEDHNVRSAAALELGKIGDPHAVDALIKRLYADQDLNVIEDITWALGRMKDAAIEPLIEGLGREEATIRHRIVHVLGKFGDEQAVDSLIARLRDGDAAVRYKTLIALGQIGAARSITAIIGQLNDDRLENRQCATEVLEGFADLAVLPLIDGLSTVDADTRELMIGVLGEIGDKRAVEPLIPYLQDTNPDVRIVTATALGQLGDPRAISDLEKLLHDDDQRVQLVAKAALKMIELA
jgi:HEAT repeat protein